MTGTMVIIATVLALPFVVSLLRGRTRLLLTSYIADAATTIAAVLFAVSLTGCTGSLQSPNDQAESTVTLSDPSTIAPPPAQADYYTIVGPAQRSYDATEGVIDYCALDQYERPTCAYGLLTKTMREEAAADGREPITLDPAGWGHNAEATIDALNTVPNSTSYHGWFWNRGHLVADSLGGSAVAENLITGTRTQNVGSTQRSGQYAGGMAYTELLARQFLDSTAGQTCPVYYAATPVYTAHELIPRSVVVDIQTCDNTINQRVIVDNTANGYVINYTTGTFTQQEGK